MIIGRPSSKLGLIRIEMRIWDPDNCFSWTTGRILIVGKYSQSFSAVVAHTYIQLIPTMNCARVDEWYICESREMEIVGSITGDNRQFFNFIFCYCCDPRDNYKISCSPGIQPRIFISGVSRLHHCCTLRQDDQRNGRLLICVEVKTQKGSAIWNINDWVTFQDIGGSKGFRGICALRVPFSSL